MGYGPWHHKESEMTELTAPCTQRKEPWRCGSKMNGEPSEPARGRCAFREHSFFTQEEAGASRMDSQGFLSPDPGLSRLQKAVAPVPGTTPETWIISSHCSTP